MQLNRFERWYVNQPLHRLTQRWWEAWPWQRMGADLQGHSVLEIGCGQGEGQRILQGRFGASRVHGIDLDARQVIRARQRNQGRTGLTWAQASACELPFADHSFDAVVAFNVLHHIPDWRSALSEVARTLRPGGTLLLHETLRAFIQAPGLRRIMAHPIEDRFDAAMLFEELEGQGFQVQAQRGVPGCFAWVYAHA